MFVCRGEIILKRDEEKMIRKDKGVHLVDWSEVEKTKMCGRDIWAERRGL